MTIETLTLIERRVIEACALVPVIKSFGDKIGIEAAKQIIQETHENESRAYGEACAAERNSYRMADLVEVVSSWAKGGALEEEIIEQTDTSYVFKVTQCMYANRYRDLGLDEFGYCLSCCRDEPFSQGFNPDIKFERHQTIMEGAEYCDFKFILEL